MSCTWSIGLWCHDLGTLYLKRSIKPISIWKNINSENNMFLSTNIKSVLCLLVHQSSPFKDFRSDCVVQRVFCRLLYFSFSASTQLCLELPHLSPALYCQALAIFTPASFLQCVDTIKLHLCWPVKLSPQSDTTTLQHYNTTSRSHLLIRSVRTKVELKCYKTIWKGRPV